MDRLIEKDLSNWQKSPDPKPLILRGARQVGKTYTVEKFARNNFKNFIKINFETDLKHKSLFESMNIKQILETLSIQKNIDIVKNETLIFLDEIQECPQAIQMLRYFYEEAQGLHVIAAGSLLEFILNSPNFKFPVGRVSFMYLGPLSFYEFLIAQDKTKYLQYIQQLDLKQTIDPVLHQDLLQLTRIYFLTGGMPMAIKEYLANINGLDGGLRGAFQVHNDIIQAYKNDFGKYASKSNHDDLKILLEYIPQNLGKKFKYSKVYPDARSSKIKISFDLLKEAGIIHKISRSPGILPLGAGISEKNFKTIMLDIGLALSIYNFDYDDLIGENFWENISGGLSEQFVGQELLAMRDSNKEPKLYYWERESNQSSAEVDYLINTAGIVMPIEVKAGITGKLKSLHMFVQNHKLKFGIRVSQKKLALDNGILSVPFYAIPEIPKLVKSLL